MRLERPQRRRRLEQRLEQRLDHVARADGPGRDPVDAGVEVVQSDVHAIEEVPAHQLQRHRLELVVQDDDVVAVPADAAADVQQQLRQEHQHRADLVGDGLGRVIVARIEGQQLAARQRVAVVELVRPDGVALAADAEQLALDGVAVVRRVDVLVEDRVERRQQPLARTDAVDRRVLHAVGNPEVGDAGVPERLADRRADAPAGDAVGDPELADRRDRRATA